MKKILSITMLMVIAVAALSGNEDRSVQTEPEGSPLRLPSDTMELGMLNWVEGGFAVFTQDVTGKQDTQRIHLYRLADGERGTIDPTQQVPEADQVNLYDVSVGKSGIVAVAANAVFGTTPPETLVGLLLLYDTRGNVLSTKRLLDPGQRILKLKVDDDDTVWAVSRGAKDADPTTAPFVYRYTNSGATASVVYTRASLPEINLLKPHVSGVGSLAFGTTRESVYCWVPEMQEMLIMAKSGSGIRRVPLAVPRPADLAPQGRPMALRMYLTEGGAIISDVVYQVSGIGPIPKPRRAIFAYDASEATWRELHSDLSPVILVGIDGERPILMSKWKSPTGQDSTYQLFKP